jgi:hypothetical protein
MTMDSVFMAGFLEVGRRARCAPGACSVAPPGACRGVNFQAHHASRCAVAAHENPLCFEPGPDALRPRWPCRMLHGLARRKAS